MTPSTPLWGTQTTLAVDNFPIAHRPLDSAGRPRPRPGQAPRRGGERRLGAGRLDAAMVDAIGSAARRIESGELDEQFPIDVYQTGSGTSTNMNVNEVIAALASEQLGRAVHPNDHVNASQSSNDTVPAAIRLAVLAELVGHTHPASSAGRRARPPRRAHARRREGRPHPPHGRHPGDASDRRPTPGPGWCDGARLRSQADLASLGELPLGGSAVGTGINVPDGYAAAVVASLAAETGLPLRTTANPMVHQGGQGALGRGLRRAARRRRGADQGGQRHPPARQRPVGRAGRAAPARAAGRLVDHARQGQPGAVRVGQPGGGAGVGQRRHRRRTRRRRASSS